MRRPFALRAEIFDGLHNASAEIHLPEAVHGDAREQRIFGVTSHFARPSRLFGAPAGSGGRTREGPAAQIRPACRRRRGSAGASASRTGFSAITITVGKLRSSFSFSQSSVVSVSRSRGFRGSRSVLQEVRTQHRLLDLAARRLRLARDRIDRFTQRQRRDILFAKHAAVDVYAFDQPSKASLGTRACAHAQGFAEKPAGIAERAIQTYPGAPSTWPACHRHKPAHPPPSCEPV